MNAKKTLVQDYNKPVAYDVNGQPLYAHPPVIQSQNDNQTTQAVHVIRPTDPEKQVISDSTRIKHTESAKTFPGVTLSEGEYIITSIGRHPIGLLLPLSLGLFLIVLSFVLIFNLGLMTKQIAAMGIVVNQPAMVLAIFAFIGLIVLGLYISYRVYSGNRVFLTNESMVQEVQTSLFSKRERIVSLADIEDVSYSQKGIVQQLFGFGSVRLSTEGEGTVYHFNYVSNPKNVIAVLSNAVEAFKNGRAIS